MHLTQPTHYISVAVEEVEEMVCGSACSWPIPTPRPRKGGPKGRQPAEVGLEVEVEGAVEKPKAKDTGSAKRCSRATWA